MTTLRNEVGDAEQRFHLLGASANILDQNIRKVGGHSPHYNDS